MTPDCAEAIRDTDARVTWLECDEAARLLADQFTKHLSHPDTGLVWGTVTFGEREQPLVEIDGGRACFWSIMEVVFAHLRRSKLGAIVHFDHRYLGFPRNYDVNGASYAEACRAFEAAFDVPEESEVIDEHIVWLPLHLTGPISYREPQFLPDAPPPRLGVPVPRRDVPQPSEPVEPPAMPEPRTRSIFLD